MRHDVAIYAPFAGGQYSRGGRIGGGAERQTYLLAQALAENGIGVAHIVLPVTDPLPLSHAHLTLVERGAYSGRRRLGKVHETRHIWQGLQAADAAVYIVRTGSPALGLVAAFCRLRRRRLVFASSTDADFTLAGLREPIRAVTYRAGMRCVDAVVVQTAEQLRLARVAFPRMSRTVHIPSFAVPMSPAERPGHAFLWIGRVVDYKCPLDYVELARALPEARFWMVPTRLRAAAGLYDELVREAASVPNLELMAMRPHEQLMRLVARAVAIVSTSHQEGMPNIFLEGWACGVPALTLDFDPDGTIAGRGIGVAAGGARERFVAGARGLWADRDRDRGVAQACRSYVEEVHGISSVGSRWATLVGELLDVDRAGDSG